MLFQMLSNLPSADIFDVLTLSTVFEFYAHPFDLSATGNFAPLLLVSSWEKKKKIDKLSVSIF